MIWVRIFIAIAIIIIIIYWHNKIELYGSVFLLMQSHCQHVMTKELYEFHQSYCFLTVWFLPSIQFWGKTRLKLHHFCRLLHLVTFTSLWFCTKPHAFAFAFDIPIDNRFKHQRTSCLLAVASLFALILENCMTWF